MDIEKKLIITTTGFYNTGSSAITHMLSEFDGIDNKSGVYEMRFIYDPDCISDLKVNVSITSVIGNNGPLFPTS